MKIATFEQVILTKLNYLGVIICLGIAEMIFVFWAISKISKANNVPDKF